MKSIFLYIFFGCITALAAQDKLYLMDGSMRIVKVLEIAPDNITVVAISESGAPFRDANELIPKSDVLLIEYKSGLVEIYNTPQKTAIYISNGVIRRDPKKDEQEFSFNFASINSFALCNADVSVFFERLSASKKVGAGFMAAYNFNTTVVFLNYFLGILNNAKKNYDAGAFVNFYPRHFKRRTTFYFGALFKYTSFSFSKAIEDNSNGSTTISFIPAKGSQMATILDVGTHTSLGHNFFMKTLAGIGGFKLRGDYKQQVNYILNQNKKTTDPYVNYNTLPKIYIGLNFGFTF